MRPRIPKTEIRYRTRLIQELHLKKHQQRQLDNLIRVSGAGYKACYAALYSLRVALSEFARISERLNKCFAGITESEE